MAILDTRTIMVMLSLWMLLVGGLFALIGQHVRSIRGIRHWALAHVLLGLGLSLATFQVTYSATGSVIVGATLLCLGIGMQYLGLQEFNGQTANRHILWLAVLVLLQTSVFVFFIPNVNLRAISNAAVLMVLNIMCARQVKQRPQGALGVAYAFAGAAFSVLAALFALRIASIVVVSDVEYRIREAPAAFALGGILELCITFGFMLMIFYRLTGELHELAIRDSLTGAYNRRNLEAETPRIVSLCERSQAPLSVMMLDVDHFKRINDSHGHVAGDLVLKHLAEVVRNTIRAHDYFARYGGEEFCILLPATDGEQAHQLAERLRTVVGNTSLLAEAKPLRCTVSIGVAASATQPLEVASLIAKADEALYQAKQTGRNQVVLHTAPRSGG